MYVNNQYRDVVWKTNFEKLKTETKQSFDKLPIEYAKAIVKLITPAISEFEKMKTHTNENESLLNQSIATFQTIADFVGCKHTPRLCARYDDVIYTNKTNVKITNTNLISLTVNSLTLEQTLQIINILEPKQ
jgi:hypothetical protein